jgi:uncharacterized protein YbjT (DUF2867 family)
MSKKLLVVFGATGNQGGTTANIVLDDPELSNQYSVRAITRSASNPKAQELKSKGAEIVEADLDNTSSLAGALRGAHTVFALTNTYYGQDTRTIETRQAKALCDEAVKQGAQYLIWSSMSHPKKISNGKLTHVDHFDVKAEIEEYIRTLPIKSAFYAPGSFMQNFTTHMVPRPSPANDGTYVLANLCKGDTKLPWIDITDTGKWIAAILADPDKYEGKMLSAAYGLISFDECAAIISKHTGKTVTFQQLPDEVFKGFLPENFRDQVMDMHLLFRDYGYFGANMESDVEWTRKQAKGKLTSLEEFFKKTDYKIE